MMTPLSILLIVGAILFISLVTTLSSGGFIQTFLVACGIIVIFAILFLLTTAAKNKK